MTAVLVGFSYLQNLCFKTAFRPNQGPYEMIFYVLHFVSSKFLCFVYILC